MIRTCAVLAVVACAMGAWVAAASTPPAGPVKVRVGVYDSRAIAVAYAPSAFNRRELESKSADMKAAEASKDNKKVKELKAWGQARQVRMHMQGFANAPVDDLLAHVKSRLPAVAAARGVSLITASTDYVADSVEVVDVTDDLVKLFEPSEKTLKTVRELRKARPIPIEQAAGIED